MYDHEPSRFSKLQIAIIADAANAISAAAISFFVNFDFLTISINVENTITPPVTIGYCTEAGSLSSAIKRSKFAILFKHALPAEYANAFLLTVKYLSLLKKISNTLNTAVIIFESIKKSALPTQYSGYD